LFQGGDDAVDGAYLSTTYLKCAASLVVGDVGMEIAILGLGRMGKGIALRLKEKGHDVVAWNRSPEPRDEVAAKGCRTVADHKQVAGALKSPRTVWLMLPSGDVTETIFQDMLATLSPGDILIDGGNSNFHDSIRRSGLAEKRGINFVDIGVSGGLKGAELGYCCMAGGDPHVFEHIEPIIVDISCPGGYLHCGPVGSGHYVKMVHNAIEYSIMQAIGEGFEVIKEGHYKDAALDLHKISNLYCNGSIIRGYLMDCTRDALAKDGQLSRIGDYIEDNGEGKWTVQESLEHGIPFLMGAHALYSRYLSRQNESFAYKIVAAQRNEFGGHKVKER
jgi:6-phosphogluconate dehydrogenase